MMAQTYNMPGAVGVPSNSTLLQARPQGPQLTHLLTEVARQREEAAQLRLRVMQAPPSLPEKPGVPKQDGTMFNWLQTQKAPANADGEARSMAQHLPLKLPQDLREESNGKGQPKLKAAPKARRTSPGKKNLETSRRAEETGASTTRSSARRSRPTSPMSPTRSGGGHAQGAPRLCISVPEHRLKPPEPQFLFSLPLRVYSGPKKLVDLSFKGSRSGSPSRGLSESPRSFMWSALEEVSNVAPHSAAPHRSARSERGPGPVVQQTVRSTAATPSMPCASARGLSIVSTPASPTPASNFAWNGMGAPTVQAGPIRSVSPAVYMQPRSISPPNVPQMRYISPPPVMGR